MSSASSTHTVAGAAAVSSQLLSRTNPRSLFRVPKDDRRDQVSCVAKHSQQASGRVPMSSTDLLQRRGPLTTEVTTHVLVVGGARSGKTSRALALAETRPHRTYIATAEALDGEMSARIAAHKAERDQAWVTIEEPLDLVGSLNSAHADLKNRTNDPATESAILIDCLTLWLSNLMHHERKIDDETQRLIDALWLATIPVVMVSNETGLGIVPENALARRFRDHQGRLNQRLADVVPHVEFIAAGCPIRLR